MRLVIIGDLGQTNFSRATCEGLAAAHAAHPFDAGVFLGDLSYADSFPEKWDTFGRMFDMSGCSVVPWLVIPGNHEVEPDALSGEPYLAYRRRWKTPEERPGKVWMSREGEVIDWTNYSLNLSYDFGGSFYGVRLGPAHFVSLNPYTFSHDGSAQQRWLHEELGRVSRETTPFLIVLTHAPWRHSFVLHQPEVEVAQFNLREMAEPLLIEAQADLLFSGHVHAYQRSAPVKGIRHVVVGNGGNKEGLYNDFTRDQVTEYVQGEHYGWGELELSRDACSWLMRRSDDAALIDSAVFAVRRASSPLSAAKASGEQASAAGMRSPSKSHALPAVTIAANAAGMLSPSKSHVLPAVTIAAVATVLLTGFVCIAVRRAGRIPKAAKARRFHDYRFDPDMVGASSLSQPEGPHCGEHDRS